MQKRVIVETPFELTKKQKDKLKHLVQEKLNLKDIPDITFKIDPNLLLDFKVKYLYDTVLEFDIPISSLLQKAIFEDSLENLSLHLEKPKLKSIGFVISTDGPVIYAIGLKEVAYGELVIIKAEDKELKGMALDLLDDKTGIIVFNDESLIKGGEQVIATGKQLSIKVSDALLGKVITPLGEDVEGKEIKHSKNAKLMAVEKVAPGVLEREPVNTPLQTGILAIDAMIPIGRGQRELIIGDRKTGKTSIAIDTTLNQKDQNVICIYCAIGKKASSIAQIVELLKKRGAMDYTIVVSTTASDNAALQFIAPYSATAIAEYFLEQGKDVLVIYDDLTIHAWAYREITLLFKRPAGREAYPGDIFYLHSRLLERACKLNKEHGGGSITAFPIIQTEASDVSAYIPTNVISITDGQIYLDPNLFNAGIKPAIDVGLSVSRVGSSAQTKIMKQIAKQLRLELAQYRELAAFAQFSSELDESTQKRLDRGKRLTQLLVQPVNRPYSLAEEIVLLYAGLNGYIDDLPVSKINVWKMRILELLNNEFKNLAALINKKKQLTDEIKEKLDQISAKSVKDFINTSDDNPES